MLPVLLLLLAASALAAPKPVFPPGVKPVGPYSPGLVSGGLVYVSGQGSRDAKGQMPGSVDAQIRQTLENVKAVIQAAGLTMDHVVYAQCYMTDIKQYDTFNKIYASYFPKNRPARSTIGVTRMPTDTPFEIAVVAVRDLNRRKVVSHPGRTLPVPASSAVTVGDHAYLTGALGREFNTGAVPKDPTQQIKLVMDSTDTVLKAAGMELRHLVYANIYVSPNMPMKVLAQAIDEYIPDETAKTIIQTAALPFGANIQISGVASRNIKRYGNCTGIGDSMYCSGRAGTIRQALESLKRDLEANGVSMDQTVSANVYVDNIDDFAEMNKIYATFFGKVPPVRTTVQPWNQVMELSLPPATGVSTNDKSPRAQVSIIAVRDK